MNTKHTPGPLTVSRDKARRTGRKANGYTAEQWIAELGQYAVNARNVLSAYPAA